MSAEPAELDWMAHAACAGCDPELFFPEKGGVSAHECRAAKAVCAECDVKAECLEYALTAGEHHGVWGGLTVRERRSIRMARR